MDHLHLLIPDLFLPQDIAAEVCAGLRLPALESLLARGTATGSHGTGVSLESLLCDEFGAQAVAPVRAAADGLDVAAGYWLCADPVNLQLHRSQMVLVPEVGATAEEAAALCDALNGHFAEAGMRFFAPHPQRWYLRVERVPQITTTPLRQVVWQDARQFQPQGADVLHWQRTLTELQMLLYGHPVNRSREARGEVLISSLWLWGGGQTAGLDRSARIGGGDSVLTAAFAKVAGTGWAQNLSAMLESGETDGLWVYEALAEACQRNDMVRWRAAVQQFDADCALLLTALQKGRLRHLSLQVLQQGAVRSFELTRAASWRLWRAAPSLPRYAV